MTVICAAPVSHGKAEISRHDDDQHSDTQHDHHGKEESGPCFLTQFPRKVFSLLKRVLRLLPEHLQQRIISSPQVLHEQCTQLCILPQMTSASEMHISFLFRNPAVQLVADKQDLFVQPSPAGLPA